MTEQLKKLPPSSANGLNSKRQKKGDDKDVIKVPSKKKEVKTLEQLFSDLPADKYFDVSNFDTSKPGKRGMKQVSKKTTDAKNQWASNALRVTSTTPKGLSDFITNMYGNNGLIKYEMELNSFKNHHENDDKSSTTSSSLSPSSKKKTAITSPIGPQMGMKKNNRT